jgi:hypothetical protein
MLAVELERGLLPLVGEGDGNEFMAVDEVPTCKCVVFAMSTGLDAAEPEPGMREVGAIDVGSMTSSNWSSSLSQRRKRCRKRHMLRQFLLLPRLEVWLRFLWGFSSDEDEMSTVDVGLS